jgi:hypothetical protein
VATENPLITSTYYGQDYKKCSVKNMINYLATIKQELPLHGHKIKMVCRYSASLTN